MPTGVLHVAEGGCLSPFRAVTTAGGDVTLDPADACSGELRVVPIASRVTDPALLGAYVTAGRTALAGQDAFVPNVLARSRATVRWVPDTSGVYAPVADTGLSITPASAHISAIRAGSASSLLRPPDPTTDAPLCAFEWSSEHGGVRAGRGRHLRDSNPSPPAIDYPISLGDHGLRGQRGGPGRARRRRRRAGAEAGPRHRRVRRLRRGLDLLLRRARAPCCAARTAAPAPSRRS